MKTTERVTAMMSSNPDCRCVRVLLSRVRRARSLQTLRPPPGRPGNWPFGLAVAAVLALSTTAGAQVDLSSVVTFGDSATHNDAIGSPAELYGVDPMEAVFHKAADADDAIANYGLMASTSDILPLQIWWYLIRRITGRQPPATLISVQIGHNDFGWHLRELMLYAPGQNPVADAVGYRVTARLGSTLSRLHAMHPDAMLVVWTLADLSSAPAIHHLRNRPEGRNLSAHFARVNAVIRSLDRWPFIVVADADHVLREAIAEGLDVCGQPLVLPPAYGGSDHLFADIWHPTAVMNLLVANEIIDQLNWKLGDSLPTYGEEELGFAASFACAPAW